LAAQVVGTERVELMAEEVRNHLPELGGVVEANLVIGQGVTEQATEEAAAWVVGG
jgi:hypothetical protein